MVLPPAAQAWLDAGMAANPSSRCAWGPGMAAAPSEVMVLCLCARRQWKQEAGQLEAAAGLVVACPVVMASPPQ